MRLKNKKYMRTIIENMRLSTAVFIFVVCSVLSANGQSKEFNETYKWNFDVIEDVNVLLTNYDCDLEVRISDGNKVNFEMYVIAEGDSEDIKVLKDYLDSYEPEASKSNIELRTRFWNSWVSKSIGIAKRIKITLKNKEKITLSELKIRAKLYLPKTSNFELVSKYSTIGIDDLNKIKIRSYQDKISGKNIMGDASINGKYSKVEFMNIGNTDLSLYDTDIVINKVENLICTSKYSKIRIKNAGNAKLTSYTDKYNFVKTGNIIFNGKYSDLNADNSLDTELSLYDSNVAIRNINNLSIKNSKYSEIKFIGTGNIIIGTLYSDKINIERAGSINITTSKYSEFDINSLTSFTQGTSYTDKYSFGRVESIELTTSKYSSFNIDLITKGISVESGYEVKGQIEGITDTFDKMSIKGKYNKFDISVPESLSARILFKGKYGSCKVNNSNYEIKKHISQSLMNDIEYVRKGSDAATATLKMEGYSNKIYIR